MRRLKASSMPPPAAPSAASHPQCRTKSLMASMATVSQGRARLLLVNTEATCGTT